MVENSMPEFPVLQKQGRWECLDAQGSAWCRLAWGLYPEDVGLGDGLASL